MFSNNIVFWSKHHTIKTQEFCIDKVIKNIECSGTFLYGWLLIRHDNVVGPSFHELMLLLTVTRESVGRNV